MPWRSSSGAETSNRPMNGARCAIATPAGVFRSRSIDHGTGKDFLCPGHAGRRGAGFAGGLAALAAVGDGKAPEPGAGADGSRSGLAASDAADGGGHALTLAARHGGAAGAADMPDGSDGPPGADDGL